MDLEDKREFHLQALQVLNVPFWRWYDIVKYKIESRGGERFKLRLTPWSSVQTC